MAARFSAWGDFGGKQSHTSIYVAWPEVDNGLNPHGQTPTSLMQPVRHSSHRFTLRLAPPNEEGQTEKVRHRIKPRRTEKRFYGATAGMVKHSVPPIFL
jgi:hypothetical protein